MTSTAREYKMTLPTGGSLYAKVSDRGRWSCEIKGAAHWYPIQTSDDPVWVSCRKWDSLPKIFDISPDAWNEFRQGVQQQEESAQRPPTEEEEEGITKEIRAKAIDILKNGKPIEYFLDVFNSMHVGDRDLGEILLYCVGSQQNKTSNGLHPKLSGESSMGKSDAVETFLHCMPKCAYLKTSLSSKSIFYHDIKPRTLIFLDDYKQNDDLDAIIKQTSSNFHAPYEHRTIDKDRNAQVMTAPEEIVWAITSVDSSQDIQVLNRQLGLDVDSSPDTTEAVIRHIFEHAKNGAERFPVTEEVLICRAMVLELRKHTFHVTIPYADRIRWNDLSSRRNPSMFLDMIRSSAVWHFLQRNSPEEDVIEASEDDFVTAKRIYVGRADTLIDKLSKAERRLVEAIVANHGEMYRDEAAAALKVSVNRISQLVHGENGKTGLLQKLPGFNAEDVTLKDEVRSVRKTMLTIIDYNRFQGLDRIVSLDDSKECKDGVRDSVSNETSNSIDSVSKVSKKEEERERDSSSPSNKLFSYMIPKKPYSPYYDSGRPQDALTQSLIVRLQGGQTLQNDENGSNNPENGNTIFNDADTGSNKPEDSNTQDEARQQHFANEADRIAAKSQDCGSKLETGLLAGASREVLHCDECGKVVDALYEIGTGDFVMRMCKTCYDAYLDDISGV